MDELIYESLCNYFHALGLKGYMPYSAMSKLLVLIFYKDYALGDYRGYISKEDYHLIEHALNCLYGSTCLISYPDYMKTRKLHIGEVSEIAQRIKAIENTNVIKAIHDIENYENDSDIIIVQ